MQGITRKQLLSKAQLAMNSYGMAPSKIHLLKTHQYASIFRIETNTDVFTLRLFPAKRERLIQAQFEVDWLTALCQNTNLRVPQPKEIIRIEEGLYAVLMTFITGKHVRKSINQSPLFKMGEFHAHLHNMEADFDENIAPRWDWNRIFEPLFNLDNAEWFNQTQLDIFRKTGELVAASMEKLGEGAEVYGLIHSDLHFLKKRFR